jgi:hypothetical protein
MMMVRCQRHGGKVSRFSVFWFVMMVLI